MDFVREDSDNCRVYYQEGSRLFCWQRDRPGLFRFFRCTEQGEPSHEVASPERLPLPQRDSAIGAELAEFLSARIGNEPEPDEPESPALAM